MKRGSIVFAAAGVIIGGAWFVGASAVRAQQPAQQAAPAPTQAVPPIGPPDPNLQTVPLPSGKNHAMGLVRQCATARAARQFRRHRRHGNDDA